MINKQFTMQCGYEVDMKGEVTLVICLSAPERPTIAFSLGDRDPEMEYNVPLSEEELKRFHTPKMVMQNN